MLANLEFAMDRPRDSGGGPSVNVYSGQRADTPPNDHAGPVRTSFGHELRQTSLPDRLLITHRSEDRAYEAAPSPDGFTSIRYAAFGSLTTDRLMDTTAYGRDPQKLYTRLSRGLSVETCDWRIHRSGL